MKKKLRVLLTLIVCAVMLYTGLTASPAVNVSAATPIKSTINMTKTKNVTVIKGNRYKMKAVIKKKTITTQGKWTSSNKKVATVAKNGVIKAIKAGKTTIKVSYKGKSLKTVVKVKATCIHKWKTTKKATCETKGTQKCSVCGTTASIAKTAHAYKTETSIVVEGRGKAYEYNPVQCNGCGINMTDWTREERQAHQGDIDGVLAGTSKLECFHSGTHGTVGDIRFPKYVMAKTVAVYCKNCKAWKDQTTTDLYEVYYDEWGNVVRKSNNKIIKESQSYKDYKPYLKAQETAKKAASNAASQDRAAAVETFSVVSDEVPVEDVVVAEPENEISMYAEDIAVYDNGTAMDEAVDVTEAVISADE